MTREAFINNLWRRSTGLSELQESESISLETMLSTEWSDRFEILLRNRLVVGGFRYGLLNEPNKPRYDRVSAIIKRAQLYQEIGNDELLVDIANLAMLEFEEGKHSKKYFTSIENIEHIKIL